MNREHIILMADASGLSLYGMGKDRDQFIDYLECFADLIASAEREACIVDIQMHVPRSGRHTSEYQMAMRMLERIKARGQA